MNISVLLLKNISLKIFNAHANSSLLLTNCDFQVTLIAQFLKILWVKSLGTSLRDTELAGELLCRVHGGPTQTHYAFASFESWGQQGSMNSVYSRVAVSYKMAWNSQSKTFWEIQVKTPRLLMS